MVPHHADPARRLIVGSVSLTDIRSYERLQLELQPGLVLIVGPNGAGKTNLLESLHMGAQGFSPRTRSDSDLIRFGAARGRIRLEGARGDVVLALEVTIQHGGGKRARVNGAALPAAEQLRSQANVLAFTPDRLAVVKGGPVVRRAYLDRAVGRLFPSRAAIPAEYSAALAQRNAALRRTSAGFSSLDALAPWTERVVEVGGRLVAARREVVALLSPGFAERAAELGLLDAKLAYAADPPTAADLEARLERDLERGTTSLGPHLDEVIVLSGRRDLRTFGSQGEQRTAVLALLLAEADAIVARGAVPPLLLLDDVLSELDASRRRVLAERISQRGQALVTATSRAALPIDPEELVEVVPGAARRAA